MPTPARASPLRDAFQRIVPVRDHELAAALWGAAYFFCLLCGYFVLRSVRDEIGAERHTDLPDAWEFTFYIVLVLVPLYGAVTARWSRAVFIPIANRFFNVQLLVLFVALHTLVGNARVYAEWTFYVWLSAFTIFVVSVFWGFMADVFTSEQAKRLFGFLAFGGSLGGVVGPALAALLAEPLGRTNLFLVTFVLLELSCFCAKRVHRSAPPRAGSDGNEPVAGGVWRGLSVVARNPYLLGIAAFIVLYTWGSTVLVMEKSALAKAAFADRDARTAFLARVDLGVNSLALIMQIFVTGRLMPRLGVGRTLAALPLVTALGFAVLGRWPVFGVVIGVEILRRVSEFALAKPAREVLFTVVERQQKYQAKTFLDAVVYRGSDVLCAKTWEALRGAGGLSLTAVAWLSVPLSVAWLALALALGRRQRTRAQP